MASFQACNIVLVLFFGQCEAASSLWMKESRLARGKWSRWGRDACEGYTLELGALLRADIVRRGNLFAADVNHVSCGSHETFEDALQAAEKHIRFELQYFDECLTIYRAAPAPKRRAGRRRR